MAVAPPFRSRYRGPAVDPLERGPGGVALVIAVVIVVALGIAGYFLTRSDPTVEVIPDPMPTQADVGGPAPVGVDPASSAG